jgi:hypothetical protein
MTDPKRCGDLFMHCFTSDPIAKPLIQEQREANYLGILSVL